MAKLARAVLCVALLQGADAFRSKQRRKIHSVSGTAPATSVDRFSIEAEDKCGGRLLEVARRAVNGALNLSLRGKSPLNTTLHAGKYEIDLWGCNAGLEIDASMQIAGFDGTHIESLECEREEGDSVTMTGRLTFGQDIDVDGKTQAQWSLCGLDIASGDSNITMGVHSGNPGLLLSVKLSKTRIPFIWKIDKIKAFETDLGNLDRFTCGLTNVPGFIGSKFEQWCVSIISWVADKTQNHLMGDVDEIFMGLVNDLLDAIPL
jgi:hypothetical protein